MKRIKKLLFLVLCLTAVCFISSCGSFKEMKVDTSLEIDKNFKGERIITASIPNSVFKSVFDDDVEALQAAIEESSPTQIYCVAQKNDDNVTIKLSIPCANYKEYCEKISAILSGNKNLENPLEPSVYFDSSNTLFKTGYAVEENFSSVDLLYWLADALKSKYSALSKMDLDSFFVPGTTQLVFNDETTATEDKIQVSKITSNGMDSISVETTIGADNTYSALIRYHAGAQLYSKMGEELDELMEARVPEGGHLTGDLGEEGGKVYELTFSAETTDIYENFMNKALNTRDSIFEVADEGTEEDSLKAKKKIRQYFNGGYFLDFTKDSVSMTYSVKANPEYTVEYFEGENGYITDSGYDTSEEFCEAYAVVSPSDVVTLSLGFSVPVNKIDVKTEVKSLKDIERSIIFSLDDAEETLVGDSFEQKIRERMTDDMIFEKTKGTTSDYTVRFTGLSVEEISQKTSSFLNSFNEDETPASALTGGAVKDHGVREIVYEFSDSIDFSHFLNGAQVTKGISYTIVYPKKFAGEFTNSSNYENIVREGNALNCLTYNKVITITTKGIKTNTTGMVLQIFWIVSLIGIIVVIVLNNKLIFGWIRERHVNLLDDRLFGKRGYRMVTLALLACIIFVVTSVRLILKIY